jgi:hypothetical protein
VYKAKTIQEQEHHNHNKQQACHNHYLMMNLPFPITCKIGHKLHQSHRGKHSFPRPSFKVVENAVWSW